MIMDAMVIMQCDKSYRRRYDGGRKHYLYGYYIRIPGLEYIRSLLWPLILFTK